MQLICEAYHLMRDVLCMGHAEMAKVSLGRGGAGVLRARSCLTLWPHGLKPTRLLSMGILQARILEWVATGFSRGSSRPRGLIHVSCIGRWVFFYHQHHLGSPKVGGSKSCSLFFPWSSWWPGWTQPHPRAALSNRITRCDRQTLSQGQCFRPVSLNCRVPHGRSNRSPFFWSRWDWLTVNQKARDGNKHFRQHFIMKVFKHTTQRKELEWSLTHTT